MPEQDKKQLMAEVTGYNTQLRKEIVDLNKEIEKLTKTQQTALAAGKEETKAYQEREVKIKNANAAIEVANARMTENIKIQKLSNGSLEQNKAILEALKAKYDDLIRTKGQDAKGLDDINTRIGTLTNTIGHQEEKLEKSRKVFDLHTKTNEAFSSSFDSLKEAAGDDLSGVLTDATAGFNAMKTGLGAVKVGFQSVGGAIKTTGFGLLLLVLQSVIQYFTETDKGIQKFKTILTSVKAVIDVFKQAFANVGKLLVDTFSNPVASIKKLGQILIDNVLNRFKALKVIWDGIHAGSFKQIVDGVTQMATGVTNVTDKTKKAYDTLIAKQKEAEEQQKKDHAAELKRAEERKKMRSDGANNGTDKKSGSANGPKGVSVKPKPLQQIRPAMDRIDDMAMGFSTRIESDKRQYEEELKLLDQQHADKLISEQAYQQKSKELQDRFLVNVGNRVKTFNKDELAELQNHVRDMFTIEHHQETMADDEKAVKKAILPADKLAAETQLIKDKYAYEIAQAHGNAETIKEIEAQKLLALAELNKKYEQDRKEFAQQTMQAASDTAFSMLKDSIRSRTDAKLKELGDQKQNELNNTSLTGSQKQAIEAKYKKKEAEEKVKAFKAEQRASILQAVINGALAITKATSQTGVLAAFAIPAIIVSTALQVATIAKQKPPQYAQGGLHYQSDGRGALLSGYSRTDNTNAYLRSGEAVVVSEAMRNPWARNLVSAINVAYGGRDFSTVNTGRGYAIGGVFTDGGNANRYYNQPVTDAKELANTMAYQMINNFPPIYVDVKDVNNQQNILAQTVNRVNL